MPNWFLHNTFADLPGPLFLTVYISAIVATIVGSVWILRRADHTSKFDLPEIPAHPDPYEIAYLRGGDNEVIRTAIFGLIDKGYLAIVTEKSSRWKPAKTKIARTLVPLDATDTDPIEVRFYGTLPAGIAPEEIFRNGELVAAVKSVTGPLQKRLDSEELLRTPLVAAMLKPTIWLGILLILGLGGYKLTVAIMKGHFAFGFLIGLAFIGSFALLIGSLIAAPNISRRGRAYLQRLQQVYGSLRTAADRSKSGSDDLRLAVALFGFNALAGTNHAGLDAIFAASNSGGGCSGGGGCGGGGCGGGGCGGCGG